jgi:hypothetical protein
VIAVAIRFFKIHEVKASRIAFGLNQKTIRVIKGQHDRIVDRFGAARNPAGDDRIFRVSRGVTHPLYLARRPRSPGENWQIILRSVAESKLL